MTSLTPRCRTPLVRRRWCWLFLAVFTFVETPVGFISLTSRVPSWVPRTPLRAAGDDFDFGDVPQPKGEVQAKPKDFVTTVPVDKELPPVARVASKEELREDLESEEYDLADLEEDEDSSGSFTAFASLAALILLVIGYGLYTVIDQGSAFNGKAAPKRQVVQAVYSTYFEEGEAKELLKPSEPAPAQEQSTDAAATSATIAS